MKIVEKIILHLTLKNKKWKVLNEECVNIFLFPILAKQIDNWLKN